MIRDGEPVGNAYVRLLDRTGEFTAEVPTSATGHFRFFAGDGEWTLRTLAPKAEPVDKQGRRRRSARSPRSSSRSDRRRRARRPSRTTGPVNFEGAPGLRSPEICLDLF